MKVDCDKCEYDQQGLTVCMECHANSTKFQPKQTTPQNQPLAVGSDDLLAADKREHLLREISGKIICPDCKLEVLYVGDGYGNPSLFCKCGFRTFVNFSCRLTE